MKKNNFAIVMSLFVIGIFFLISFGVISVPNFIPFIWLRNDKMLHFLSGFALVYGFSDGFKISGFRLFFFIAFLSVGWEIFENIFLITDAITEIIGDLAADFTGAYFFLFLNKILGVCRNLAKH